MKTLLHSISAMLLATFTLAAEEPLLALAGNDPVALSQGVEAKGKEDLAAVHGRYRYLFTKTENKQKFESAPDKYGIQFDGYCMKMGPLSGRGSPDRWFLADQRIYLFASDSCRDKFKADPAAFTDRADAPPTGTEADRRRGQELIKRALEGFGGADKVDALKSIRWEARTTYEQAGKKTDMIQATTVALPDRMRLDYTYGKFSESHALADGQLVEISSKNEVTPMPADVRDYVQRRLYHEPLALLRARNQPGFVAFAAGSGEVSGAKVEWLNCGYRGATTKLGIDPKTGRILATVYHGRTPAKLGEITKSFSDFKASEGGLELPQDWTVAFDGKAAPAENPTAKSVALNPPLDARSFPKAN